MRSPLLTVLTALSLLGIPATHAASLGDAFSATFKAPSFSYQDQAGFKVAKGGKSDLPFDLSMTVQENGGKQQGNFGKTGEADFSMKNIQDVPSDLGNFNSVSGAFSYRGTHVESSGSDYAEIIDAHLETNNPETSKITDMLNQFAKFLTGRTIKSSREDISKLVGETIGSGGSLGQEQVFLNALSSGKSIDEIVADVGQFTDSLIGSGVFHDEVTTGGSRSQRRPGDEPLEHHHITLGSSISDQGAETLKKGMMNFVSDIFPGVAGEFSQSLLDGSDTFTVDLNDFLKSANAIGFEFNIDIGSNLIQDLSFRMDLNGIDVPLTISDELTFDYSKGFNVVIPEDTKSIIDMNTIAEGMLTIMKLSGAGQTADYPPAYDGGDSSMNAHPGENEALQNIMAACPDSSKRCAMKEMRKQLQWLRNQHTRAEMQEIRKALMQDINVYFY